MKENEIRKYIFDLAIDIAENYNAPRYSTLDLLLDHFNTIPNHMLYKFRACNENNFRVLESNSIYMCRASNFSDKLDSALFYDYENFSKKQKQEITKNFQISNYAQAFTELKNSQGQCFCPNSNIVKEFIRKCYDGNFNLKLRSLDKFIKRHYIDFTLAKDTYIKLDKLLGKHGRGSELQEKIIKAEKEKAKLTSKRRQDETFVCSLTENYKNLPMWENYADNYTGFCIGYEFNGVQLNHLYDPMLRACMLHTFPMAYTYLDPIKSGYDFSMGQFRMIYDRSLGEYEKNIDVFNYFVTLSSLIYKNKDYSWEREWRIILFNLDVQEIYFPFATSIYLGRNITKKNKNRLLNIAKKLNLSVYQQQLNEEKARYDYILIYQRSAPNVGKTKTMCVAGNLQI